MKAKIRLDRQSQRSLPRGSWCTETVLGTPLSPALLQSMIFDEKMTGKRLRSGRWPLEAVLIGEARAMCMQLKILDLVKSVVDTSGVRLNSQQIARFKDVLEHAGALSAAAGECPGVEECPCAEGDGITRFYSYLNQLGISLTTSQPVSHAVA